MMNNLQEEKKALMSYVNSNNPIWSDIDTIIKTNNDKSTLISDYKIIDVEKINLFYHDKTVITTNASYSAVNRDGDILTEQSNSGLGSTIKSFMPASNNSSSEG